MIHKDIVQRLYVEAEAYCCAEGRNEAWLFEMKFAELIVRECAKIAVEEADYCELKMMPNCVIESGILRKFGVTK